MSKSKVPHDRTEFDSKQLGKMCAIGSKCEPKRLCSKCTAAVIVDPVLLLVEEALATVSSVKAHVSHRNERGDVVRRERRGINQVGATVSEKEIGD